MEISIKRQDIHAGDSYEWYLHLRERVDYQTTSGFGMGVERFITWLLGLKSIHDACIYPVIKNDFK